MNESTPKSGKRSLAKIGSLCSFIGIVSFFLGVGVSLLNDFYGRQFPINALVMYYLMEAFLDMGLIFSALGFLMVIVAIPWTKKMRASTPKVSIFYYLFPVGFALFLVLTFAPGIITTKIRARQAEAKQNLGAIYVAYMTYHNDYGTYPLAPSIMRGSTTYNCLSITGWAPAKSLKKTLYSYQCMNTFVFFNYTGGRITKCPITTGATKDSFTVAACGNVDNDEVLDVWTINDAKSLTNVISDPRIDAWSQIPGDIPKK